MLLSTHSIIEPAAARGTWTSVDCAVSWLPDGVCVGTQGHTDMGPSIAGHELHVMGCVQNFELVLFCAIAVHITVITTESGVNIQRLDHQGRKVAAQAVDVVVLVFYLCALP